MSGHCTVVQVRGKVTWTGLEKGWDSRSTLEEGWTGLGDYR